MNQIVSSSWISKDIPIMQTHATSSTTTLSDIALQLEQEYRGTLTRVEEIIFFAKQLKITKNGIAYCSDLLRAAKLFADILEMEGFNAVMFSCKKKFIVDKKKHCILNDSKEKLACNPLL